VGVVKEHVTLAGFYDEDGACHCGLISANSPVVGHKDRMPSTSLFAISYGSSCIVCRRKKVGGKVLAFYY
jgi:hypothetical protein